MAQPLCHHHHRGLLVCAVQDSACPRSSGPSRCRSGRPDFRTHPLKEAINDHHHTRKPDSRRRCPQFSADEYIGVYKHLHAHPELSAQEYKTAEYIERHLTGLGIQSFRCGGTGVVGIWRNGDGPVIGFRATPMARTCRRWATTASQASGTLPNEASRPWCAATVAATTPISRPPLPALPQELSQLWGGTLVLIFQPGEETAYGAKAMIDDGLVGKNSAPRLRWRWPNTSCRSAKESC